MKQLNYDSVTSSIKMLNTIAEDASDTLDALQGLDKNTNIPVWWTNKLAVCSAYINSLRDYLVYKPENSHIEVNEEYSENTQIRVGNYTTEHFDMCPAALELYRNIAEKTDMIHLVVESMMLHDIFFKLEKQAIAMGSIDQDMVKKAQHYADMILALAREMSLEAEHSYIQNVHMAKFKELASSEIVSDDTMLPPSVRLVNYNYKN
jgi:hypothetical protein